MKKDDIVKYVTSAYDARNIAVLEGVQLKALVTRVRENGLIDVVFGDDAGIGHCRTSVGVNGPNFQGEGHILE